MGEYYVDGQLFHHGIKGMKWGVRRYQNADGSLTAKGRKRYGLSGTISVDGAGRMTDSGTGKRISGKTKKLVENRMISDKTVSKKVEKINKKHSDAKTERDLRWAEYNQAREKYESDMNRTNSYGNTFAGLNSAINARASRIVMDNAKTKLTEAENKYKSVQAEVNSYIANYANEHISDFQKG